MLKNINFKVNDILFSLNLVNSKSITILEACLKNGIYIPHFCYNKYLNIAGNCRICLIEVEKFIKPIISCLNFCLDNLNIYTFSFSLKKYRENVLEFLLINHPLDCPICDQAGECDLQEQTLKFGLDKSRFFFIKKTNIDIFLNNYIKLILNRCILCLRCIRFLNQKNINNYSTLGVIGRGFFSKIHLYNKNIINNFGSANIIDICPVGALTLKKNQFSYRPWEFYSLVSIDIFDSFAGNIQLDFKFSKIIRILPYLDSIFMIDFISDLTRFKSLYFFSLLFNDINKIDDSLIKNINFSTSIVIFNIFKNCLINLNYLKDLFINIISNKKYFFFKNFNYFNFNNIYILNLQNINNNIIFFNNNLVKFMYRFFLYLFDLKIKTKNLYILFTEDFKLLNIFNIFQNLLIYNSIYLNKSNNIFDFYLIKYLNFLNILLTFEIFFLYFYLSIKNIFFDLNFYFINFSILNIFNKNFNNHLVNIQKFKFLLNNNLFNILGFNFINSIKLITFLKELNFILYNIKFINIYNNYGY